MALTERRYIILSRGGLVQRAPLQTQSVRTILTTACTNCKCLPEIATSAYGLLAMTNLIASRRRMRAAKIASLQGAH